MGAASFTGLLFLGCGPLAVVFVLCLASKSFLVLLALGSAFYWLCTLLLISALFRAWAPLEPSPGPYVGLLLVAVLIQELARVGIWRFHKLSCRVLNRIAQEQHDAPLSVADRFGLALAYGFSHGAVHSAFFFAAWLPLALGDGTIYSAACPRLSFYTVGALSTLGMAALLTGAMVLWLDGLERRDAKQAVLAPATHLAAALLTLANFADDGCLATVPLLLAGGAAVAAAAGRRWWQRTTAVPRLAAGLSSRQSQGVEVAPSSSAGDPDAAADRGR